MKLFNFLSFYLLATCAAFSLSAYDIPNEVNFSAGYRNDHLSASNTITALDGSGVSEHFHANNFDMGEVGIDFRYGFPMWNCCDRYPCLTNFYLKGSAFWGWSGKDDFYNTSAILVAGQSAGTFSTRGRDKARTEDYDIGVGYILYDYECWSAAVTTGYAYNRQHVRTSNALTAFNDAPYTDDLVFDGLVYKQRWQGAWLGGDLFYSTGNVLLDLGYEYHLAHYNADLNTNAAPQRILGNVSDRRRSNRACGNVVYLNGSYILCDNWKVGLGLNFKHFHSRHGHVKPETGTFAAAGFPAGSSGKGNGKWVSYSLLANVGYIF